MAIIELSDLPAVLQSSEMVDLLVAGVNARAARVAPCLAWTGTPVTHPAPTEDQLAEARLVLVGAVKRWAEAGAGAIQSQAAGIFSQTLDTRQRTGFNLWPSEISALQDICRSINPNAGKAFSIDTAPTGGAHLPWCSLAFGALWCSCGADIAGEPIYELD